MASDPSNQGRCELIRDRRSRRTVRRRASRNKPYRHSQPWRAGEQSMAVGHCAARTGRGGQTRALPRCRARYRPPGPIPHTFIICADNHEGHMRRVYHERIHDASVVERSPLTYTVDGRDRTDLRLVPEWDMMRCHHNRSHSGRAGERWRRSPAACCGLRRAFRERRKPAAGQGL